MADTDIVDDTPDVSMIDTDFNAPLNQESEDTADEAVKGAETQDEEEKSTEETEKTSEDEQPSVEKQETEQDDEAAARKAQNEQYARQRIQERQRVKQTVEKQVEENYGAKTEQELIDEGYTEQQAQIEALRQEMQFERQKTHIAELNAGMQSEAVNIINDFPIFNPKSPEYDPDFVKEVEEDYKQDAQLQVDENGIVINASRSLYDYYARQYNRFQRGATKGQAQGQQEYQQMMSRTENPGGSSSTSKGDSLSELEERLGDVVIT